MSEPKPRRRRSEDVEQDDAPVRKKKSKKKPAPTSKLLIAGIAGGSVVVLALLAIPVYIILNMSDRSAKPVTTWDKYSTPENEFGLDYPAGWRTKSYGIHGKREVEIRGSGAKVEVKENITGSLVGDIAGAMGRGAVAEDDERSPVAAAHEMRKPKDLPSYQEGKAVTVTSRFGKARRSEYTNGSTRGYRATVLMHQTALDVFCECRAADWDILRPAFERMIESLGPGGG